MPLNADAIFPASDPDFVSFPSRRSVVHSTQGIVTCTQPLATEAGLRILSKGGNAADAAVAVAAALNVTEPSSTGLGGDVFSLFYDAKTKSVRGINGSGRTGQYCDLDRVRAALKIDAGDPGMIPMKSALSVTVPGAAAGWIDVVDKFGSGNVSIKEILTPAIELCEKGFPVSELASSFWRESETAIRKASSNSHEILKSDLNAKDGFRAPRPGEVMKNPGLGQTLRLIVEKGKKGFYEGRIAEEIIKVLHDRKPYNDHASFLNLEDLRDHGERGSEEVDPISLVFRGQNVEASHEEHLRSDTTAGSATRHGIKVWECPPNGQGIVTLMALGILEQLEKSGKIPTFAEKDHNSSKYLHALIESFHIAFADATWFVTDPSKEKIPVAEMLSETYLRERAKLFDPDRASETYHHGSPAHNHCDTVYFSVTDSSGNGCSFISSLYGGFGSAIVPRGCGFPLQNRGANFTLVKGHPNVLAPNKRPYHTIIPALITNVADQSLHTVFGVMGGFMQPQGQVQVLLNMMAFKLNPQVALDAPRICIGAGTPEQGKVLDRKVHIEEGIRDEVVQELAALGHDVEIVRGWKRGIFGRGQIIRCHAEDGQIVYSAGSDPRGDGAAAAASPPAKCRDRMGRVDGIFRSRSFYAALTAIAFAASYFRVAGRLAGGGGGG